MNLFFYSFLISINLEGGLWFQFRTNQQNFNDSVSIVQGVDSQKSLNEVFFSNQLIYKLKDKLEFQSNMDTSLSDRPCLPSAESYFQLECKIFNDS